MKKTIAFFCIPTALLFFIYNTLYPSILNNNNIRFVFKLNCT